MMKRMVWFVSGAVAGVSGASFAKRKVRETASNLAPSHVAKTTVAMVRGRSHDVADAVRDGRAAMRAKESELKARRDGTAATLADVLQPDDEVLIDGVHVHPADVVVVRHGRDRNQAGPRRSSRRGRPET